MAEPHFAAAQWVYGRHGERAGTVANGRSLARHRRDRRRRAPRFVQGVTGTVALIGAVFGWPLAWALMAAQLLIGLTVGRRFCLPCAAYFTLVQPRSARASEDSRPPRLANMIGTAFLGSAAALWVAWRADGGSGARLVGGLPRAARGRHRSLHGL